MSIESRTRSRIVKKTDTHWSEHVRGVGFSELISGKEPGHRMADYVDDQTTSLLKVSFDTRYEGDKKGEPKKRSMGDIWIHSSGIFNPVNVKAGLQGMKGQPNVVSMQKLLDYLFHRRIDSYYLLIIKFDLANGISHKSYMIDLLDWTDFITYNAGPGQIMLREKEFYDAYEAGHVPAQRAIQDKVASLFDLFEKQLAALFKDREKRLRRQRAQLDTFHDEPFEVDQSAMRFVL